MGKFCQLSYQEAWNQQFSEAASIALPEQTTIAFMKSVAQMWLYIPGDEAALQTILFQTLLLPKQPFLIIQQEENSQLFLKPLSACDNVQVQISRSGTRTV